MTSHEATPSAIYHEVARHMMQAIEGPWSTATLYVEIEEDDNGLFYGRYRESDTAQEEKFFEPHYELLDLFVALRQQFHKPGTEPWQKATFTLTRRGQFDLDFVYPDDAAATEQGEAESA